MPALPGQPQNVVATDGTHNDRIRVTWSSVSGATRYEVWRADTDTGTATQVAETTGTSFDDTTAVVLCVRRWYEVRACNISGCGPFSVRNDGYRGATLDNVDGTRVTATVVPTGATTAEVRLSWVDVRQTAEYGVRYEVWRRTAGTTLVRITTVPAPNHTDTGVLLGTTYFYRIRACSTFTCITCSAFTGEIQAVVACNPAAPTGTITATWNTTTSKVDVTWTTVTGATNYQVFRSTSADGTYDYVGATFGNVGTFSHTSGPGTFFYKVKTCVACGCGPLSAASNSVTVPAP
jgi:fibronectin type 3 domain-containing protein